MVGNLPKFSSPIFINARVFNKLPTDLPNFSSPKTLESLICQNFPTYSIINYLARSPSAYDALSSVQCLLGLGLLTGSEMTSLSTF